MGHKHNRPCSGLLIRRLSVRARHGPPIYTMTQLKMQVTYQEESHRNSQGQLHRLDGPCSIWPNGTYQWRKNGLLHREDGPAVFHPNSIWGPFEEYWLNGKCYKLKYQDKVELNPFKHPAFENLSD